MTLSGGIKAAHNAAGTPDTTISTSPLVAGSLAQDCQNSPVSAEPARSC